MSERSGSVAKARVLFMQSQTYFGADSYIHSLLMRHLDRNHFEVHVAYNAGSQGVKSAAAQALEQIPDIRLRSVYFGPSVNHRPKGEVAREALLGGTHAALDLSRLAGYMRRHRIGIVHCTEKPRDALYGLLLARLTGAKCLVHLHVKAEGWISPMVRWSMKRADALVGVSAFVASSIATMGYRTDRISYVHNALDPTGWDPTVDGSAVRQEFGIESGMPLLLIASRLFYWKGHTELLHALAKVKEGGLPFRLLVVGEDDPRGHPGGGSYRAELESLVSRLGLTQEVTFTGYRSDIPRLLAACDVFTMPSYEEPFGMVYLEAMAMQKPVIALDNGGAREVVEHERSGLLSPPKDVDRLAANIRSLLVDDSLRRSMGAYGRRLLLERFTPQRLATEFELVYGRVLKKDSAAPGILARS
jgi:glycosyltransferase involved in cell wall biosynthesis